MSHITDFAGNYGSQHADEFMAWLKRSPGVSVSSKIQIVELMSKGAGRGVVASQDISEDEELFTIPPDLVLNVKNSEASKELNDKSEDLGQWLSLVVVMMHEFLRGDDSKWAPYFRVLPTQFDTLMFWTESETDELQGSAVVGKIGKKTAEREIFGKIFPVVTERTDLFPVPGNLDSFASEEGQEYLLALAHRMSSLIMAYAFDVEDDERELDHQSSSEDSFVTDDEEERVAKGMIPLADLLNADADRNNARLFQEDHGFVMKSTKPIAVGEEIFNDYGELPRADLLRRYGYVTDNYAKYDVVEIPLQKLCDFTGVEHTWEPGQDDPQLEYLEDADLLDDGYSIPRFAHDTPLANVLPKEFLAVFRVLKMSGEDIKWLRSNHKFLRRPIEQHEAASLAELVNERIKDYPTTLEEDAVKLADLQKENTTDPSHRRRIMAIQVRQGEKEILVHLAKTLTDYATQSEMANKRVGDQTAAPEGSKRQRIDAVEEMLIGLRLLAVYFAAVHSSSQATSNSQNTA